MAGETTIQRLPLGLLDLLGMQSTGSLPRDVSNVVVPTVDIFDLYLQDRLQGRQATSPVIAATGGSLSTVGPGAGEMWFVYGVTGATGALAAATGFTACLAIFRGSTGFWQFIGPNTAVANPATYAAGATYERPLIMRPGDALGVWISAITGAPGAGVGLTALFVSVRI